MATARQAPVILVLGSTGAVGSALCRALANGDHPYHIRALTRNLKSPAAQRIEALHHLRDNVSLFPTPAETDDAAIASALERVKRIFFLSHLQPSDPDTVRCWLSLAKEQLDFALYLSSDGADVAGYGEPHAEIERILRSSGVPSAVLRPTRLMDDFISPGKTEIFGVRSGTFTGMTAETAIASIDARDIADVACRILTSSQPEISRYAGQTCQLTGSQAISNPALALLLSQHFLQTIAYRNMTEREYRQWLLSRRKVSPEHAAVLMAYEKFLLEGGASHVASGVQDVMGQPARSWPAFLAEHGGQFLNVVEAIDDRED